MVIPYKNKITPLMQFIQTDIMKWNQIKFISVTNHIHKCNLLSIQMSIHFPIYMFQYQSSNHFTIPQISIST